VFSADETTDVGRDSGTPVGSGYTTATSRFTGRIHWVQLDVGPTDADHVVSPEERMRVAMARQ
jgi:arylsulfatase